MTRSHQAGARQGVRAPAGDSYFSFSALPRAVTLVVRATSAQDAAERADRLLADSDLGLADLAAEGFHLDQLGFGDPEIEDVTPADPPPQPGAPPPLPWIVRLDRAPTSTGLADVLEGVDTEIIGSLHQFLEHACERFRADGDEQRAAAFTEHAKALRLISDELSYTVEDLRAAAPSGRVAAARYGPPGRPPGAPGTRLPASTPQHPQGNSSRSR